MPGGNINSIIYFVSIKLVQGESLRGVNVDY